MLIYFFFFLNKYLGIAFTPRVAATAGVPFVFFAEALLAEICWHVLGFFALTRRLSHLGIRAAAAAAAGGGGGVTGEVKSGDSWMFEFVPL